MPAPQISSVRPQQITESLLLTKDQAQAASDAVLRPARTEHVVRAAELAQRQRAVTKRKWLGGGALLGLAVGSAAGKALSGEPFTASIVGCIMGAIIGAFVGKLRA